MSNPYLEKAASLYDFWNNLTGKEHADLKARKYHLERAIANGDTVEGLSKKIKTTGAKTFRARAIAGGSLGTAAALGLYGAKKYSDHQNDIARENLYAALEMQKMASESDPWKAPKGAKWAPGQSSSPKARPGLTRSLKGLNRFGPVLSGLGAVASQGTKSVINLVNTAHGGKVKAFGEASFGKSTPNFKKFIGKSGPRQDAFVLAKLGKNSRNELRSLKAKQRAAQVGVYGTAAAGMYAYNKGKTNGYRQAYGY